MDWVVIVGAWFRLEVGKVFVTVVVVTTNDVGPDAVVADMEEEFWRRRELT